MNRIMICGSRDASDAMLAYAKRCVQRAADRGDIILVGDADGVDRAVVEACTEFNVPCVCLHVTEKPRNGGVKNLRSININVNIDEKGKWKNPLLTYTDRDEMLARSASIVIGIWNGVSKGTKHVVEFASASSFKRAYLVTFETGNPCVVEVEECKIVQPSMMFQQAHKV